MHFQKAIAIGAAGLACTAGLLAATTPNRTTHPTSAAAPAPKKTIPAHGAKAKPAARRAHSTRAGHTLPKAPARPARSTWRTGQTAPTPDRYKEIQTALAQKGYLQGEATGVWNQDSAEALRRFQQDQNLQASGKLDSLSIIALGLGPKY